MKNLALFTLFLAVASAATVASATGTPPPPPPPPPAPTPVPSHHPVKVGVDVTAGAKASSSSSSLAGASSSSQATQTTSQTANQTSSLSDLGNSNVSVGGDSSRSNMWVLPAPVFTPPLPPIANCPSANVDQMAIAGGWSFLSYARGSVNTDNCTAIILYNQYVSTCKWKSAQQVLDLLSRKVLPDFQQSDVELFDMTREQCNALVVNPKADPQPPVVNYVYNYYQENPQPKPPTKVKEKATGPCPAGQKRNSKGVCYKPCPCDTKK